MKLTFSIHVLLEAIYFNDMQGLDLGREGDENAIQVLFI